MENPKFFGAFVNGILRNTFYGDESITPEYLGTELFADHDITIEGEYINNLACNTPVSYDYFDLTFSIYFST